jgi:hypothetical protein
MFVRVNRDRFLPITNKRIQRAGVCYEVVRTAVGEACTFIITDTDHERAQTYVGFEDICQQQATDESDYTWLAADAPSHSDVAESAGPAAEPELTGVEVWEVPRYSPRVVNDVSFVISMARNDKGGWVQAADCDIMRAGFAQVIKELRARIHELEHG